jgi:hypothetical protein
VAASRLGAGPNLAPAPHLSLDIWLDRQCSVEQPPAPGAKNKSPDGWIVEKQMGVKH